MRPAAPVPVHDLDPEVALTLVTLVDAHLAELSGAATLRRVVQAVARDAFELGRRHGVEATGPVAGCGQRVTLLTLSEYARAAGCSTRTARRRAARGELAARRTPGGWLIEVEGRR